ncbi:MAG: site-2 protease family protein [Actinobacteria bacterium]|nr:site-2 protease family protein [Actinomycetota bacterium]
MKDIFRIKSIHLFTIKGIPVLINPTWILVFLLIISSVFLNVFPEIYPGGNTFVWLLQSIFFVIVFFTTLLSHELAHSLVARRLGIDVMNITLHLFGGTARILREPKKPLDEAKMAIAGPLTSFLISLIFYGFYLFFHRISISSAEVLYLLSLGNFGVAIFNLIPAFPLDGGRLLRSLIWKFTKNRIKATIFASNVSSFLAIALFLFGIYFGLNISGDGFWFSLIAAAIFGLSREAIPVAFQSEILEKKISEVIDIENLIINGSVYYYDLDYFSAVEITPETLIYDVLNLLRKENPSIVKLKTKEGDFFISPSYLYDKIFEVIEKARDIIK